MRIQLKQNEIEEALTGFVSRQGISTQGKDVTMTFKSGRKNNGLSVVMVIEDAEHAAPTLEEQYVSHAKDAVFSDIQDSEVQAASDLPADAESVPATPTSLFG